jgi:hypothetical protein
MLSPYTSVTPTWYRQPVTGRTSPSPSSEN